ncbi:hypothetical protein [Agromyces sp. NPDC058126]|uniref:hypothetical protein n=1 Tax=Agromyces sp. NPDC058126 TaxID=3346350 RepID=UPI0036DF62A3
MTEPDDANGIQPESIQQFRMAQLLLALAVAAESKKRLDLERLAVIEFLAANPFLVIDADSLEAEHLRLKGFGRHSIAYASPGQRFVSRRQRIMADVAQLVVLGLARVSAHNGRRVVDLTQLGHVTERELNSVYADAYRASSRKMVPVVAKLTDAALYKRLQEWLRSDPLLFDLLDVSSAEEWADAQTILEWRDQ